MPSLAKDISTMKSVLKRVQREYREQLVTTLFNADCPDGLAAFVLTDALPDKQQLIDGVVGELVSLQQEKFDA